MLTSPLNKLVSHFLFIAPVSALRNIHLHHHFHYSSYTQATPFHDVTMLTSPPSSIFSCWISLHHTYFYNTTSPLKQYKKTTQTRFTHSSAQQRQRHYSSSARQLQRHYYIMASNNVDELQNLERIEELCRNLRSQQQQSATATGKFRIHKYNQPFTMLSVNPRKYT